MAIEDALDEELGLDQQQRNLVGGMLENGKHPNAIRNTINKQRLGGWTEPKTKNA
jgi:hypothetical protein